VQLRRLDEMNEKRIANSLYLLKELEKRQLGWLTVPKLDVNIKHTFFWCPILVDEEAVGMSTLDLAEKLKKKGVETRHRYHEPLYRQKVLGSSYKTLYLKNAEKIARRVIGLPNHPNLSKEDLDCVISALEEL